jgi:large repetitive protein
MRRRPMRLKLALVVVGVFAVVAVTGASAADFEHDEGPCHETPGEALLGKCPTGYVGVEYEIEILSEEGSGCEPYDYFQLVNSTLPAGLSMTSEGVISGVPTSAGYTRFWLWDRDLTFAQGGPSWCDREDKSEREFSIQIDPGLAIVNESVKSASIGQPYSETLTAKQVASLNSLTGPDVQATWSLQSGALPAGMTLSAAGVLSGTPIGEGEYEFDVRAHSGGPEDTETYTLTVRQPLSVKSPFGSAQRPSSEVGVRLRKTFTATGGSGTYTWALASGALPTGVTLDAAKGAISGTPQKAGTFAFALTATDSEGRVANASAALAVAPKLAVKTIRLKSAKVTQAYQVKLATAGGVQPVSWTVVRGKLPRGIKLSQKTGTIAGTPSRVGSFPVTFEARDALGVKSQKKLVLLVQG